MILNLDKVNPILQEVFHPIFDKHKLSLKVLRLDMIDSISGGNKWFKLKFNLEEAKKSGCKTIISFGGPYSNHIAALAKAGEQFGFNTVGIIRGQIHDNLTLNRAKSQGMKLIPCDFGKYRTYRNHENWEDLYEQFPDSFIIPEGGSNFKGFQGCKLIADFIPENTDFVFLPVGTGTTMAGLIAGNKAKFSVEGVAVVKAGDHLNEEIDRMIKADNGSPTRYFLHHDFTFGGYAKSNAELNAFTHNFIMDNKIPIEPIYTGRMFYAIFSLANRGYFSKEASIIAIHTGGNQYYLS